MAISTVSNTAIAVEFLADGQTPAISSLNIAKHFQKKHRNVLRDIEQLRANTPKSFTGLNFEPSEYTDPTGRTLPCFLLTRDAFSLLAMGFTGVAAMQWKLKYIEAFNALEAAALENARTAALQEGMRLQKRMTPSRRALVRKVLHYHGLGLSQREVGKLVGRNKSTVQELLRDARLVQGV
ncbi:Rha family transcriptional regulator [Desulfovibrio cuneatus]|uniref:Rha family transcriptional regulator n=1 Tax=Desulfovibrio cuneatus TaxID=159728 RepID=UPI0006873301|nr:Rha family transcriptional regulator [Desulfovibrio cuneatus]